MSLIARAGARLLRATVIVDRAYEYYCRARSLLVTAAVGDRVLGAYSDLAHGDMPVYDAGSAHFRESLFGWEEGMIGRVFPPPPARVLVGGAGGGREAFQLAARGYEVVAFEPAPRLARSMAVRAGEHQAQVRAFVGRYEDLPLVRTIESAAPVDLRGLGRWDAALIGWTSYSHVRHSRGRSAALAAMAALTDGPVVASFYARPAGRPRPGVRGRLETLGRRAGGDAFSPHIGFYHWSSADEISREVAAAGLRIVDQCWEDRDGNWPWIAVARDQAPERVSAAPAKD